MYDAFSRMENLVGIRGMKCLGGAKIAVFGIGGVGSYVVEALARCGVGSLTLVDHAEVTRTDINRQLYALESVLGQKKVQQAKKHIRDIDENILVHTYETSYGRDTAGMFDLRMYDYIVDTMDTAECKSMLIEQAVHFGIPVISCLTTKNRMNPSRLEIADISRVSGDMLAKTIRTELRRKNIKKVKVLFSKEKDRLGKKDKGNPHSDGSIVFVQGTAGMLIAGEVVRELLAENAKSDRTKRKKRK